VNKCAHVIDRVRVVNITGGIGAIHGGLDHVRWHPVGAGDTIVTGVCAGDYLFNYHRCNGCQYVDGFTITEGSRCPGPRHPR